MKRLAAPMVGGVASAMLLTRIVTAAIYVICRWQTQVKQVGFQGKIQNGDHST
jgi:Cu/Ag efflux pump CusA